MISVFKRPFVLVVVLVLVLVLARSACAQTSTITSFQNGQVTFTGIDTSLEYRVEWMSRLLNTNGFSNIYNTVEYITPTNLTAMTVDVPMFFRIAATNALSNNIYRASDLQTLVNASTNAKLDLEWSESPNGPWSTNWQTVREKSSTGNVLTIQSPRYYRVDFVNCPSNCAACTDWLDATDSGADRTITFPVGGNFYSPNCLKIKAGQSVTYSGPFSAHPFRPDCQDQGAMTNQDTGVSTTFLFTKPGYYGFHCANHGSTCGVGNMSGNIWVIP